MNKTLLVPDIGDFEKVEVIEILVKKGDKVSINDPVITIESDKSSVEIPSSLEGTIDSINVKIGFIKIYRIKQKRYFFSNKEIYLGDTDIFITI